MADLIDHLSSDLDASRGRIDILPTPAKPHSSMFPYPSSVESVKANSPNPQYVGVSSPGLDPHAPVFAPRPRATVPAAGFSPKRQLFVRQGLSTSPGAVSFASSGSEVGRTVEDRLQALLDRLQDDGAEPMRAA